MAISPDERAFFVQLGAQIAELRKAQGITQIQMAEALSVSQQTINSYEVARRRIPASALPTLAKLLTVSIDEILGAQLKRTNGKRGPASKLQQQIERVSQLSRAKQRQGAGGRRLAEGGGDGVSYTQISIFQISHRELLAPLQTRR